MQVHVIHSHFSHVKYVGCHQLCSANLMTVVVYVYFWVHAMYSHFSNTNYVKYVTYHQFHGANVMTMVVYDIFVFMMVYDSFRVSDSTVYHNT